MPDWNEQIRKQLAELNLPQAREAEIVEELAQHAEDRYRELAEPRFTMLLPIVFAATALLLSAVGIYGVMAYAVTRRTHEPGIRAALGASRRETVGLVLRQGMKLAAIGIAAGLVAAVVLARFMTALPYGVRPADPATLAAVTILLGGIALLACYIPARRATSVDPAVALRCE